MIDLGIRGDRGAAILPHQETARAQHADAQAPARQTTVGRDAASITLRQLMSRLGQAESSMQAARQTVQTGEAMLAEVREGLEDAEALARESAEGAGPDRAALQSDLEQVVQDLERILQSGADQGLFASGESSGGGEGLEALPAWLLTAMTSKDYNQAELLAGLHLGLDGDVTTSQVLAALSNMPLEDSRAASYLAGVYLGAMIAGGGNMQDLDPALAADGLRQLVEMLQNGVPLDEAIQELTGGVFSSLEDFQLQFMTGTAPGLEGFLTEFMQLPDLSALPTLVDLLGGSGGDMDLLLDLMSVLDRLLSGGMEFPEDGVMPDEAALPQPEVGAGAPAQPESLDMGTAQMEGQDLSGVSYDPAANEVTVTGGGTVALTAEGQEAPVLRMAGEGIVEVREGNVPTVTVETSQAHLRHQGEISIGHIQLREGSILTVEGRGLVKIGTVRGGAGSFLRLTQGAAVIGEGEEAPQVPVVVDGPVSLIAAQNAAVQNAQGKPLSQFDVMWKLIFPDWTALNAASVDGKQGLLGLRQDQGEIARMWLLKGDGSQGYPAHSVVLQGRDKAGHLQTQYVYVRWNPRSRTFQEVTMYPNPFTVTGGEEDVDWRYEEDSRTLRVLTGQVTGISGGNGTDANQMNFSGRVALTDGAGSLELNLNGVTCRVTSGRAFSLGRGNRVNLLLERGTRNLFESGPGCAGISLGDGSSLRIDQAAGTQPNGTLTAAGGTGSPGIGHDSGQGNGSVLICCEGVTAIEGKPRAGLEKGAVGLPKFRVSSQALKLDAMDISTKEAAKDAMRLIRSGRRWITKIQESYRSIRGKLEQDLSGLYSVHRHMRVVRDEEEADSLMWDLRQELLQSPIASYSQWGMEDVDQLLQVMMGKG